MSLENSPRQTILYGLKVKILSEMFTPQDLPPNPLNLTTVFGTRSLRFKPKTSPSKRGGRHCRARESKQNFRRTYLDPNIDSMQKPIGGRALMADFQFKRASVMV